MQFTRQDLKLIESLRKRERQWRWLRWALPGLSVFIVCCYGYIGVSLYQRMHWEALTVEDAFVFALFSPKILLAVGLAAWFIVWPVTNWRGNATRLLLLKLLDEQTDKKTGDNAE